MHPDNQHLIPALKRVKTYLAMVTEIHLVPMRMLRSFSIKMPRLQTWFKSPRRHVIHMILRWFSQTSYMRRGRNIGSAGCASKY